MRKEKINISTGLRLGKLTVGDLVYGVQDHPLFLITKQSYLQHGRLRECLCDCGELVLYSENALASGFLKSCGCLRKVLQKIAYESRVKNEEKKLLRREIKFKIIAAQSKLKLLQTMPIHLRSTPENNKALDDVGAELRKLFATKARVNRK